MDNGERHREQELLPDLVEQVFGHLPAGLAANFAVSLILIAALWENVHHVKLVAWLAAVWTVSVGRLVMLRAYRRSAHRQGDAAVWARYFTIGVVLTGIAWGSAGVIFFSREFMHQNIFIAFFLGGMISGGMVTLAGLKNTAKLYIVLLISPIMFMKLLYGQAPLYRAMAAMLVVYGSACLIITAQIHRTVVTSLRLRRENLFEIEERKRAEEELRLHKERLEETVEARTAEIVRTYEALKEERDRLTVTLTSIGEGVIATGQDGAVKLMNAVAGDLTGRAPGSVVGVPVDEVLPLHAGSGEQPVERLMRDVIGKGETVRLASPEVFLVDRMNAVRDVELVAAPIKDMQGTVMGMVIVFNDVTERNRMEAEVLKARKIESLGVLAGGIAHDFNNILTAIVGNLSLAVTMAKNNKKLHGLLVEAEKASLRARGLTQQLLTFSRGGDPLREATSVSDVIRESADFVLHGSKVVCRYEIPDDLWLADIDPAQISQVVQNIILNASDAMPDGGVVTVTCENVTCDEGKTSLPLEPGRYVRIVIRDEGVGIPAEYLEKIFDPYFTTKQRGSGLGLAITHSIVTRHGGHIDVTSAPGKGTTFTIHLPASDGEAAQGTGETPATLAGQGTIIVMDDEEIVRDVALNMLRELGYEVHAAADGQECIALFRKLREQGTTVDAVILDLTVAGGMGGKEAMETLLQLDPAVKAIVSSGYSDDPVMARYGEYGFRGAVTKPFRFEELGRVVRDVIAI